MVNKTSAKNTESMEHDSVNSVFRQFDPSLYPKTYQPLFFNKLFGFIIIFIYANMMWIFFTKVPINYESIFISLLILFALYITVIRHIFGYKVTLFADRVDVDYLFSKKTMLRTDIKTSEYRSVTPVCVKLNQSKYWGFVIHTLNEFEEDNDFINWFNTLDAEIIEPISK